MLPRAQRLTTREFAAAFANGRALRHPLLQVRVYVRRANAGFQETASVQTPDVSSDAPLKIVRKRQVEGTRAACVVAKKIGKAIVRNRLRRRVREIYRLHPSRAKLQARGFDLIFLMSPSALTAPADELQRALDDLLRRISRL